MKKIIFFSHAFFKGGRWGRTYPLAKFLSENGKNDVTLIVNAKLPFWKPFELSDYDNIKLLKVNTFLTRYLVITPLFFLSLNFWVRLLYSIFHKCDATYADCSEMATAGIPCLVNKFLYHSKYFSEYGDLLGKGGYYDMKPSIFKLLNGMYYLWIVKFTRTKADYVIALSSVMKNYILNEFKIPENKILLIPGGSWTDLIEYKQPENKIIKFGYIGIGSYEFIGILPILQALRDKYAGKVKVLFFGELLNPDIINKYGLSDIIEEKGWIDVIDGQEKISEVDIFMIMRTNSIIGAMGWPNKLGDYLAFGRPVIIEPYGDLIDFVNKHNSGFISVTKSSESIEHELHKIFTGEYDLIEMGKYNRTVAEKEISWQARSQIINNLI